MNKYKIVTVTNRIDKYPQFIDDSKLYPFLIEHIGFYKSSEFDDFEFEIDTFVVEEVTGKFWNAEIFFEYESHIKTFYA